MSFQRVYKTSASPGRRLFIARRLEAQSQSLQVQLQQTKEKNQCPCRRHLESIWILVSQDLPLQIKFQRKGKKRRLIIKRLLPTQSISTQSPSGFSKLQMTQFPPLFTSVSALRATRWLTIAIASWPLSITLPAREM